MPRRKKLITFEKITPGGIKEVTEIPESPANEEILELLEPLKDEEVDLVSSVEDTEEVREPAVVFQEPVEIKMERPVRARKPEPMKRRNIPKFVR